MTTRPSTPALLLTIALGAWLSLFWMAMEAIRSKSGGSLDGPLNWLANIGYGAQWAVWIAVAAILAVCLAIVGSRRAHAGSA